MAGQLVGPGGQPIGAQPVVAHVIEVSNPSATPEDLQAIVQFWQQRFGVPAIVLTHGVSVVAQVLADGTLQELAMEPEMAVKVKAIIDNRVAQRAAAAEGK